jgi:hypothetical protein
VNENGSCPTAGFCISGVEYSALSLVVLVRRIGWSQSGGLPSALAPLSVLSAETNSRSRRVEQDQWQNSAFVHSDVTWSKDPTGEIYEKYP